jgi:hypothetical protein
MNVQNEDKRFAPAGLRCLTAVLDNYDLKLLAITAA